MAIALVIESDERDAERLRKLLGLEDVAVLVCASLEAVECELRQSQRTFHLALVSWEFPEPPAFQLLIRLRHERPGVPVVVLSGALDADLAGRAAKLGAKDYLEKPLDSARVRSCVRALLATSDPLRPAVDRLRTLPLGQHGERLLGDSQAFLAMLRQLAKVVLGGDTAALITGESGTGKELVARAIHLSSSRANEPMVAVNVGAIPSGLIESLLFGHEKGAFTDAREMHRGYCEEAEEGTLFLDEIGVLNPELQVKLLRVIQERTYRRVGGSADLSFRARLICATNRDLASDVAAGRFRDDLFYRIAKSQIHAPPLRDRAGDVETLLYHFLARQPKGKEIRITREALRILKSYRFPGNVRELENLVEHAAIQCDGLEIRPLDLPLATMGTLGEASAERIGQNSAGAESYLDLPYRAASQRVLQEFERVYLQAKLDRARGNITRAAASCGMDPKTFRKHWAGCGLPPLSGEEDGDHSRSTDSPVR